MKSILIANRGEIAIRVSQACAELGVQSVAVHTADDAACLHTRRADQTVALAGTGPSGYLDIDGIVRAATQAGCDAVHPGYGFLSESAVFAQAVIDAGLTFIGPTPATLERLGDKISAIGLARELGVPVNPGLDADASAEQIVAFMDSLDGAPVILKAAGGGGGRGMRIVSDPAAIPDALRSAQHEALQAFGNGSLFVERFVDRARHIEVQILGDGNEVVHAWERDCTLQRRHQKLIEIAPAPNLDAQVREQILNASVRIAEAVNYRGLGTFEFLVGPANTVAFIEANPRVQVEHTVTEAVTGIDLIQTQIRIAGGESLKQLGLTQNAVAVPRGAAIQVRVNLETMRRDGSTVPAGGLINAYEPPGGLGVRVDGHGYAGLQTSPRYDSLLAKVICHADGTLADAVAKTRRALRAFRVEGVQTNIPYLHTLLDLPELVAGTTYTSLIEDCSGDLFEAAGSAPQPMTIEFAALASPDSDAKPAIDDEPGAVYAPMQGTIVSVGIAVGDVVGRGAPLMLIEAMKMEYSIPAPAAGTVSRIAVKPGQTVHDGEVLALIELSTDNFEAKLQVDDVDPDYIRPDLAEVNTLVALTLDSARDKAVQKRRRFGSRTARENIDDLVDDGSFTEYGGLTLAAQRSRRSVEDLQRNTPADGIVTGFASVNAAQFGADKTQCAVLAYDYTVLAGTQGHFSHMKTDRILKLARKWAVPVIFYTEGGGGRPGDVDTEGMYAAWLAVDTFALWASMNGIAPRIAVNSGRCFAGNAVMFGLADITIATRNSNIGLAGPAMIEGGGLGQYTPEDIGPASVQNTNGVIDILVEDEVQATRVAREVLGYFQGRLTQWTCPDQRALRSAVPESRVRVYDMRALIRTLSDSDSVTELRPDYGPGMITALIRIEGQPFGVIANDPRWLGGAIDSEGGEKAGRFLQLCDTHGIPILSLCDTPGYMVGPDSEVTASVRRGSRLLSCSATLSVPLFAVITRKAYGLGAQAMVGGSFVRPAAIVSWPTGEFGPMGLEGAVRLGFKAELEALPAGPRRDALYDKLVAESYARGKAVSVASFDELDAVIDPAETRQWISRAFAATGLPAKASRGFTDVW